MRIIVFLFGLFFGFSAFAQQDILPADLNWGFEYKEPNGGYLSQVIHTGSSGIFAVREKREGLVSTANAIFLERYDSDLRLEGSQQISLKYRGKVRDFESIFHFNDRFFLFTSFYNQAHENRYLFVQEIDQERLRPSDDIQMIGENPGRDKDGDRGFDFRFAPDSSRLLVYNQLPQRRQEPERFHLRVFDDQMDMQWEREVEMPFRDDAFRVEEYRVDREGNVYLLGVLFRDGSRVRRGGQPTYQYILLVFPPTGNEAQQIEIDPGDYFITDLTFRTARNGDIICSGFYSLKGTYSIKGTCFFRITGNTLEVVQADLEAFQFDFVSEFLSERRAERASQEAEVDRPELFNYRLDELILRSDGGALLVAEQYFTRTFYSYDWRGAPIVRNYYYYNDIIVVNISPAGSIEWACRVPKRQETVDDGGFYSSYSMAVVRDRLFFLYNDNPRNFETERTAGRIYNYNGGRSVIALAEVQRTGEVQFYALQSNQEIPVISRPKMCKQTGSREMILYGERNRRYMFGRLSF